MIDTTETRRLRPAGNGLALSCPCSPAVVLEYSLIGLAAVSIQVGAGRAGMSRGSRAEIHAAEVSRFPSVYSELRVPLPSCKMRCGPFLFIQPGGESTSYHLS
jgi:hypothetical protein